MSQVSRETFGVKSQMRGGGRWRGGGGGGEGENREKGYVEKATHIETAEGRGAGCHGDPPPPLPLKK